MHHSYIILNVTANTLVSSLTQVDIRATNSTEHRPSREANRSSGSQAIAHPLWNPKVHYCAHNRPLPVPVLTHSIPVQASLPNFLKTHFNIIPHLFPGLPNGLFPSGLHTNTQYAPLLLHTCYMPRLPHSSLERPNNTRWPVQIWKLLVM